MINFLLRFWLHVELDCDPDISEECAFLSSGLKGVELGKCGPPSLVGEERANAWSELTGFVNYKLPLSGPH